MVSTAFADCREANPTRDTVGLIGGKLLRRRERRCRWTGGPIPRTRGTQLGSKLASSRPRRPSSQNGDDHRFRRRWPDPGGLRCIAHWPRIPSGQDVFDGQCNWRGFSVLVVSDDRVRALRRSRGDLVRNRGRGAHPKLRRQSRANTAGE